MKLSHIALRNIFRNGRRSLLSILAVALAAFAITFLFALFEGIKDDIMINAFRYESGEVRIRHSEFEKYEYLNPIQYTVEDYAALLPGLEALPGVSYVSPRINVNSAAFIDDRQIPAVGLGLDIEREIRNMNIDELVVQGRLPRPGTTEAVLAGRLARDLGVEIGDRVTFLTQTRTRGSNAFTVDVVGIVSFSVGALNMRTYILPIESADRYLRMDGGASELYVVGTGRNTQALHSEVQSFLDGFGNGSLSAVRWQLVSSGYAYIEFAGVVYNFIALFFFLLGSTVIINTTMMTIHERTKEIGTLSSLGMHKGELIRLFFTESVYLGFFGSLAGVLLGTAVIIPVSSIGIDMGTAMDIVDMGISSVLYPRLNVRSTVGTFFFSFVVAIAASFLPARRAAKLKPVDALRG